MEPCVLSVVCAIVIGRHLMPWKNLISTKKGTYCKRQGKDTQTINTFICILEVARCCRSVMADFTQS